MLICKIQGTGGAEFKGCRRRSPESADSEQPRVADVADVSPMATEISWMCISFIVKQYLRAAGAVLPLVCINSGKTCLVAGNRFLLAVGGN